MEGQGIVLNESESIPSDPYTIRRIQKQQTHITPYDHNYQLERFLALDRQVIKHTHPTHQFILSLILSVWSRVYFQVLRFFALLGDLDSLYREKRPVTLHYYLVDDSVEICEHHEANNGRDPFPVLLRRQRVPKHIKPACGEIINTQVKTHLSE